MMKKYHPELTATAYKDLQRLPTSVRKRIILKLDFILTQPDPLKYAVKLTHLTKGGDYRFRIGNYRVVFDIRGERLIILYIEHRKEVYVR